MPLFSFLKEKLACHVLSCIHDMLIRVNRYTLLFTSITSLYEEPLCPITVCVLIRFVIIICMYVFCLCLCVCLYYNAISLLCNMYL